MNFIQVILLSALQCAAQEGTGFLINDDGTPRLPEVRHLQKNHFVRTSKYTLDHLVRPIITWWDPCQNIKTCKECADSKYNCFWHGAGDPAGPAGWHAPFCRNKQVDSTALPLVNGKYRCPACSIWEGTCHLCKDCEECSKSGGCAWHVEGPNNAPSANWHPAFCANYCLTDGTCLPANPAGSTTYDCPREEKKCQFPDCNGCKTCDDCAHSGGCAWHTSLSAPNGSNPFSGPHGAFCANYCLTDGSCVPATWPPVTNGPAYTCPPDEVCPWQTCKECQTNGPNNNSACAWHPATKTQPAACLNVCLTTRPCLPAGAKCPAPRPTCKWPFCSHCESCEDCQDAGCAFHTALPGGHGPLCLPVCYLDGTCLGVNDKCPPFVAPWWEHFIDLVKVPIVRVINYVGR